MGKVMTGDGTVTHIPNHVPKEAKVAEPPKEPEKAPEPEKIEQKPALEEGLDAEDADLTERVRKKIAKKHRQAKEAEEAAQEAERFAEQQYNERVLADRRAEAAEARATELQAQLTPPKTEAVLQEPDERDPQFLTEKGEFDWKKFAKALSQYETHKALAEREETQKQAQEAAERSQKEASIRASTQRARERFPDFDQVLNAVSGTEADQVPQYVLNYLGETEHAGLVAYHLAKHPEDAIRISKLKPILGLAELGKLESKLTAEPETKTEPAPAVQRGGAPPPIVPLEPGSASVNTDPAKMSYKELRAYERARMRR